MSCSFFKTYGQAQSMAANLVGDPKCTVIFVYLYESQAQRIREWMRGWAKSLPELADWEQRIKFHSFNAEPVLETLPKITVDEMQEFPPDVVDAYKKVFELIEQAGREKETVTIPTMSDYLDNEWNEGDGLPGPAYRRKYGVEPGGPEAMGETQTEYDARMKRNNERAKEKDDAQI